MGNTHSKAVRVSKEILKYLLLAGAIYIAASSPYFVSHLLKSIPKLKSHNKRKITSAFQYLKSKGLIEIEQKGLDVSIVLTKKGRKRAGKYQIDDLQIKIPERWDKKWRVIIFDIPNLKNTERNAFRAKLKELGFYSLQKSVWVCPFDCQKEIQLLREFFNISPKQIRIVLAESIENDQYLRKIFKL